MITGYIIGIIIIIIFAIDAWLIIKKGKYHSISATIIRASHKHPVWPFLAGFVCAHLFWSMKTADIWIKQ